MKNKILILGKLPPPYMGPAVATRIILNSDLKDKFDLYHLDTRLNRSLLNIGKFSLRKISKNIDIYLDLKKILKDKKPDLVLIPISQSTLGFLKDSLFILISRMYGRKVLIHLRGSNIQNWLKSSFFLTRMYVEWVIRRCQSAIVLGENLRYLFEKYFPPEKIFVVPNGANYHFPAPSKDPKDKVKVLFLANLQSSKGIEDVVEAIKKFNKERNSEILLDVIGAWRNEKVKQHCIELVEKNRLSVTFHQVKISADKLKFLINSDIFIFPPREPEGHPWVIIEAMAAGLPIIATDQGAISESVIDGVNGFIVEKRNPEQISEKIKYLMDNPEIRKKMGKKSREFYLNKFTEEKMVENLSKAFISVTKI